MTMLDQDDAPATKGDIRNIEARMATKDDIAKIEARMATKDDLKAYATKDDLKAFATKDDLKAFATKDDLQALASEVKDFRRTVSVEHAKLTGQMQDFKEMVRSQLDHGISRMMKLAEDFAVQTQKVDRHQIITDYRVDLLEGRVKTLESPRP